MSTYLSLITDRIGKISIIFGIAFLLVGLALSMVMVPGEATEVNGQGNCDTGWVYKDESSPFSYSGSETIVKAIVKSGQGCFPLTISSPSDGCYQATGLGTTSVSVTRIGIPHGDVCQSISHVKFYAGPTDPPATDPPATDPPATDPPATDPPATDPPATDPPVTDPPPTTEAPATTDPPATTQPPATTEPPVTTDPPTTTTPTEEVITPTPPPTMPQPTSVGTSQVLIPQTGIDLTNRGAGTSFWLFLFMGLGLVGTGIVFHGVASQIKHRK
jgi:hypothetical protein